MKAHTRGSKQDQLSQFAKATLGSGDMRQAVALPKGLNPIAILITTQLKLSTNPGEDLNEWLAVNSMKLIMFCQEFMLIFLPSCRFFQ